MIRFDSWKVKPALRWSTGAFFCLLSGLACWPDVVERVVWGEGVLLVQTSIDQGDRWASAGNFWKAAVGGCPKDSRLQAAWWGEALSFVLYHAWLEIPSHHVVRWHFWDSLHLHLRICMLSTCFYTLFLSDFHKCNRTEHARISTQAPGNR